MERLEAELASFRPTPLSSKVVAAIADELAADPPLRLADRFLLAAMSAGSLAACVIVGLLTWQFAAGAQHPSAPQAPILAAQPPPPPGPATIGQYQQALARHRCRPRPTPSRKSSADRTQRTVRYAYPPPQAPPMARADLPRLLRADPPGDRPHPRAGRAAHPVRPETTRITEPRMPGGPIDYPRGASRTITARASRATITPSCRCSKRWSGGAGAQPAARRHHQPPGIPPLAERAIISAPRQVPETRTRRATD
jgi:hypothetical protein